MSQMPSGVHSPGTVLSPSTTRTIAFFMFAFAVPNEFFISAGTGVIFRIIGNTYSSILLSSHSTTPSVWVVMFVTRISEPPSAENWSRTSCESTRSPEVSSSPSSESTACTAAPIATASSGLTSSAMGTLAIPLIISRTDGMRLKPPVSKMRSI